MKRKFVAAIVVLSLSLLFAQTVAKTVYVTANGKKYHTQFCRTIKNSSVTELTVEQAQNAGYEPCGVCKP